MSSIKVQANRILIKRAGLRLGVLALLVAPGVLLSVRDMARKARASTAELMISITVNSLQDTLDSDDGKCTFREAITAANTDTPSGGSTGECIAGSGADTIVFDPDVTGTITLTGTQLAITSDVTIDGPGAALLTVSGNNASRVFQVTSGTVTLAGLTISQGRAIGSTGGGITNSGILSIINCIITDNSAGANGGGIFSNTTLTVSRSTISDNLTEAQGGGLRFLGTATITNSTISGNSARGAGGGISAAGTLTINHVTISNNTAVISGGGISGGSSGGVTLTNTIVAGNFRGSTRDDLTGTFNVNSAFNLIGDGTGMTGLINGMQGNQVGTSGSPINPLIGPLQFNGGTTMTHTLRTGSPAIDKGNSTLTPDQRGLVRPFDDAVIADATGGNAADIGAVELQSGENLLVTSLADTDDGLCDVSNCTLREAIAAANANPSHNAIYFSVTGTIARAGGQLTIDSDLTINGPGARLLTVKGNHTSRVFEIKSNRTSALYGMTISEGTYAFSDSAGGGVFNQGTLAVGEVIISDNKAAGLWNIGVLDIRNSTISGNLYQLSGGGVYNAGTLSISNSTITGNFAAGYGGGLVNFERATLTNTTITNNRCNTDDTLNESGGGIAGFNSSTSNFTIHNSIVAGNFPRSGTVVDEVSASFDPRSSFNLIGNGTGLVGVTNGTNGNQVGTTFSPIHPLLSPLQFNGGATPTHALFPNSPAIDKGNSAFNSDQRGITRPVDLPATANATGGNGSDIGAVEVAATESLVVNTSADTSDGVCDADNCTLREAVNAANANADFNLITFSVTGTIILSGTQLTLNSDLAINNLPTKSLTINGNNASRIFLVEDNRTVALSSLVITNGRASGDSVSGGGGAIRQEPGSYLSIENCVISNSQVDDNGFGSGSGGGISNRSGATLVISHSVISGNVAIEGGGVYAPSAARTFIRDSTISNNSALNGSGGGIVNFGALIINNSTISNNSAQAGGAVGNFSSANVTINNSTISGNSANFGGAGISSSGTIMVVNTTLTNNRCDSDNNGTGRGGGISHGSGTFIVHNSIVGGNFRGSGTSTFDDLFGPVASSSSFNLIADGTGMTGITNGANGNQVGTSANRINPRLGPLANNGGPTLTHALLSGSPALDAGSNALVTSATDQRGIGFPRTADGPDADAIVPTVDIGAFEAHPSIEDISDKITSRDTPLSFSFNVGDVNLNPISAIATSTNNSLIPAGNLVITGDNRSSTRTLQITPAAGQTGEATIIVTVQVTSGQSMSDSFLLSVNPPPPPTVTWDGGGTTNNWTEAANWVGDVAPTAGAILIFPDNAARKQNLNNFPLDTNFGSITITGNNYDIGGNSITLSNGLTVNSTSPDSLNRGPLLRITITLTQPQTFTTIGGNSWLMVGQLNLNGFGVTVDGTQSLTLQGRITGAGGIIKNGSGTLLMAGNGNNYTGTTQVNGGTLRLGRSEGLGATGVGNGTVINNSSRLVLYTLFGDPVSTPEAISLNGEIGTDGFNPEFGITGTVTLEANSVISVFGSRRLTINSITQSGGSRTLTKVGTGTLIFTGTSNHSATSITSGTLLVNGSYSGTTTISGGTLGGIGTVGGVNANSGSISPGASPGILNTGNVTFSSNSSFVVDIGGPTPGTHYDRLVVNGNVALNGANLSPSLINGFMPAAGDQFTIINKTSPGAVTGTFNNLPEGAMLGAGGTIFTITYVGGDGNDVTLTHVPDPGAVIQFSTSNYSVAENTVQATLTIFRTGETTSAVGVDYFTTDSDNFTVGCAEAVNSQGGAFGRCDFATAVGTLQFAAGETQKQINVSIIDDVHVEGPEAFQVALVNPVGATLGNFSTATVTIQANDSPGLANPIFDNPFFVRQHYLDFLSREPEQEGFNAWLNVLNTCSDVNNLDPNSPNASCDRILVSQSFFGSPEFRLKGFYVFRFYKLAFNRLPEYPEIISDMAFVAGATAQEVFQRTAELAIRFTQRPEFISLYGSLSNSAYVNALLSRYQLTQITTIDPQQPDGTQKVTLSAADLTNQLNAATLTRAQVLRAIADSDQVGAAEFNNAFVAMQYYGYLRRKPETAGFNAWLGVLQSGDTRTMVNGFMNSTEYRLRFGPP